LQLVARQIYLPVHIRTVWSFIPEDGNIHNYGTLYPQKLAITSPTSGGRSVGVIRSRTQTMEFVFVFVFVFECDIVLPFQVYPYRRGESGMMSD
jgi:hypothetical protein